MAMNKELSVEIFIPNSILNSTNARFVTGRLTNRGAESIIINERLAIGYRDHLAREIFMELLNPNTGDPVRVREVDYNRDFSTPDDYRALLPGESIEKAFDFFKWYIPEKSGEYILVMHYQADEPLASPPVDILRGIFSSSSTRVSINMETSE
jgi:hypothetical protein